MEKQIILVIRLSSIGDIIQSSAVPRLLREKFPLSELHWVIRSDNMELLAHNPYVTQLHSFDRTLGFKGWWKFCRKLSQIPFTHVYDAHNNIRSHLLCCFLKPQFFIRRSKERFRRILIFWLKMKWLQKYKTGIKTYMAPLEKWGIKDDGKGSELYLKDELKEKVNKLLETKQNLIALAPSTAWPKKTWPEENWKNLIQVLLTKTDAHFIILGGPQDDFCKNLILNPERVHSFQGRLSLLESAAALSFCKTLIAADTGVLHMAEALGINVVGLRGPTHLGFTYRKGSKTLTTDLWCQPCSKDGRGICINTKYQRCMTDITVLEVFESLEKVLHEAKA